MVFSFYLSAWKYVREHSLPLDAIRCQGEGRSKVWIVHEGPSEQYEDTIGEVHPMIFGTPSKNNGKGI
jgi:hypothetical protein